MRLYRYGGNAVRIQTEPAFWRGYERLRVTCRGTDEDTPPVLLEAAGGLGRYLRRLMETDCAERFAPKVFYYDRWCLLHHIEVAEAGAGVKTVDRDWDGGPFFGLFQEGEEVECGKTEETHHP